MPRGVCVHCDAHPLRAALGPRAPAPGRHRAPHGAARGLTGGGGGRARGRRDLSARVEVLRREHDDLVKGGVEKERQWTQLDDNLADLQLEISALTELGRRPLSKLPSGLSDVPMDTLTLEDHMDGTSWSEMRASESKPGFSIAMSTLAVEARDGGAEPVEKYIFSLSDEWEKVVRNYLEEELTKRTLKALLRRTEKGNLHLQPRHTSLEDKVKVITQQLKEAEAEYHDAVHARDTVLLDIIKSEEGRAERAKQWKKSIENRRMLVKMGEQLKKRQAKLDDIRREEAHKHSDGYKQFRKDQRRMSLMAKQESADMFVLTDEENEKLEKGFDMIKRKTGIKDLNTIVEKFVNGENVLASLHKEAEEGNVRVQERREALKQLQQQHADARFRGGGIQIRKDMDVADTQVKVAESRFDRWFREYSEVNNLLKKVSIGVFDMLEKMSPIKVDVEIKDEAEEIEMLQMAEAKLMKVYELLGIDPLQMDGSDLEENALEAALFYASNNEGPAMSREVYGQNLGAETMETPEEDVDDDDASVVVTREMLKASNAPKAATPRAGRKKKFR